MADITSGLLRLYTGDDAASSTLALDSGSQGINALLVGAGATFATGKLATGGGISLTGGAYLSAYPVLDITNLLTISVWVNCTTAGSYPMILSNSNAGGGSGFELYLDASTGKPNLTVTTAGGAKSGIANTSILSAGWKHVFAVYNGTDIRIYIDGVLDMTPVAQTGNISQSAFVDQRIGNRTNGTGFPYTGSFDDLRIYNVAKASTDAVAAAANGVAAKLITITDQAPGRIFQRTKGTTSKTITISGTYTGTAPASIEVELYTAGTTTSAQTWTRLTNATIGGGVWSGSLSVPQGWYHYAARSKDASGAVIDTSWQGSGRFGVSMLGACIGESLMANSFISTSGLTNDSQTRRYSTYVRSVDHDTTGNPSWQSVGFGDGATNLSNKLRAGISAPIGLYDSGVGGTTIANWTDPTPGSAWRNFLDNLNATGGDCEFVFCMLGVNDAIAGTSKDAWKAGLRTLFANLQAATGRNSSEITLVIALIGSIDHDLTDAQTQNIRQGTQEFIAETTGVIFGGSPVEFALSDGLHYAAATSYGRICLRMAQAALHKLGLAPYGAEGVHFGYASVVGSTFEITLIQDGGTALKELDGSTDGGSLTGWEFFNNGTPVAYSSSSFSGNKVIITPSGGMPAGFKSGRYQWGQKPDVTNPVFDNTSPQGDTLGLPLQPQNFFSVNKTGDCVNTRISTGIGTGF